MGRPSKAAMEAANGKPVQIYAPAPENPAGTIVGTSFAKIVANATKAEKLAKTAESQARIALSAVNGPLESLEELCKTRKELAPKFEGAIQTLRDMVAPFANAYKAAFQASIDATQAVVDAKRNRFGVKLAGLAAPVEPSILSDETLQAQVLEA